MSQSTRREFLGEVGKGMLIAGLGSTLVANLGLEPLLAGEGPEPVTFGDLEPLAALMQQTAPERLQPLLVERIKGGTDLRTLVAAGALANARTFGGEDYVGFHAAMALMPAYRMSQEMPARTGALPVLKVLYRNAGQIQKRGGRRHEKLRRVAAGPGDLRDAVRRRDMEGAERIFARLAQKKPAAYYNDLQLVIQDDIEVHRVVLAWRAWDLLQLTGMEHAHTMLRQSVRHCVDVERKRVGRGRPEPRVRIVLPRLLDEYKLLEGPADRREPDDQWVDELSRTIFAGGRAEAAEAVAAALAEGFDPEAVGEAISLAANRLLLHDPGGKDGIVHGASVGVHASDSANAWRNIARVVNRRNAVTSLVVGAYHTAGQARRVRGAPFPYAARLPEIDKTTDADALLRKADAAIRTRDQARAAAAVHKYGALGHPDRPLFDLLIGYATSEDGKLHAEKYFRTVSEEFRRSRRAFRWRHLVALARVTASEYGTPAPGYADAVRLLQ